MSDMKSVLLSAPYMIPVLPEFRSIFEGADVDVIVADVRERLSEEELLSYAGKVDGVISGDDRFTASVLEAFYPRLKVISKWGTGIDSIDQDAAGRLGVQVRNTPDAFTDAVADSVMAYVLSFARGTPWMDRDLKSGGWDKRPGRSLRESTLGVVGVGRIGQAVLKRGGAFGMRLLGNDIRTISEDVVRELGVSMLPLAELLAESDFISLNCDLNPTSHHLINAETLRLVRPGAILVNTSRGPVVEEGALIDALRDGTLSGAGLDVFEQEPLPADSPLRQMDQVLLAPHNANSSPEAWSRVHRNTIDNLFDALGLPHVQWQDASPDQGDDNG
jgi:D-3-phosphoglycerate dehydrogenase